jgi:predicted negative regulator of RcsB-dependent stress response
MPAPKLQPIDFSQLLAHYSPANDHVTFTEVTQELEKLSAKVSEAYVKLAALREAKIERDRGAGDEAYALQQRRKIGKVR